MNAAEKRALKCILSLQEEINLSTYGNKETDYRRLCSLAALSVKMVCDLIDARSMRGKNDRTR